MKAKFLLFLPSFVVVFFAASFLLSSPSYAHPYPHNPQAGFDIITMNCVAANTANFRTRWVLSDASGTDLNAPGFNGNYGANQDYNVDVNGAPGTAYTITITPYDDYGVRGPSQSTTQYMPDCRPPDPPGLSLSYDCFGAGGSARLVIAYSLGARSNFVRLMRSDGVGPWDFVSNGSLITSGVAGDGSISYTFTGTDYNAFGGSASATSNSVTPLCAPDVITGTSLSWDCAGPGGSPRLRLTYTSGLRTTSVRAIRSPDAIVSVLPAGANQTFDSYGSNLVTYFYAVSGYHNVTGLYGPTTNTNSVTPDCQVPTNPNATLSTACVASSNYPYVQVRWTHDGLATNQLITRSAGFTAGANRAVASPTQFYQDDQGSDPSSGLLGNTSYGYSLQGSRAVFTPLSGWVTIFGSVYAASPNPILTATCTPTCAAPGVDGTSTIQQGGTGLFVDSQLATNSSRVQSWQWSITRQPATPVCNGVGGACTVPAQGQYRWSPIPNVNGAYNINLTLVPFTGPSLACPVQQVRVSDNYFQTTNGGDVHANGPIQTNAPGQATLYNSDNLLTSASYVPGPAPRFDSFKSAVGLREQAPIGAALGTGSLRIGNLQPAGVPQLARYDYTYFDNKLSGIATVVSGSQTLGNGGPAGRLMPSNTGLTDNAVYKVNGNLTLDGSSFKTNTKLVFLVNGDLNITGNFNGGGSGSYYVFIVSGNVNIYASVAQNVTQVNAFIVANGTVNDAVGSPADGNTVFDQALTVTGSLIGYGTVTLQRQIAGSPGVPTIGEFINYDPGFIVNVPSLVGATQAQWKELAP